MPTSPDDLVTYLRLSPEFGSTRFGPFEGLEVRLGSDPDSCHIVLPESLGVRAEHAKLIRQGPQNLILAPSERTATVFLYKSKAHRPTQLNTPTAVRPGDSFALVTPDGPRFIIELDELPPEIQEERAKARGTATGRRRLSADSMGKEVKRQAWTQLLVLGPAQLFQRAMVFVRSGAIYQPRNIILGLTLIGGYAFGGFSACKVSKFKKQLSTQEVRVESCNQELAFAENMQGDSTEYKLEQLAQSITGIRSMGTSLEEDDKLRGAWKDKMKVLSSDSKRYQWITNVKSPKAGTFAEWRDRMSTYEDVDPDTAKALVWLGAWPGRRATEFADLTDSEGTDVCGRGPLQLTFRQALRLGLDAMPDTLVVRDIDATYEDKSQSKALIQETLSVAGAPPLPEDRLVEIQMAQVAQGSAYCIHQDGDDQRTNISRILRALGKQLGPDAALVPPEGTTFATTARIAKYWSADVTRIDYNQKDPGVDFTQAPPGTVLDAFENRGAWVVARSAETLAKAVLLPCLAVLSSDADKAAKILGDGNVPSPINCLVLDWRLRND
ncbi:MAG: hypothetical protein GXP62_17365 [Oligoflexia bacterium]|nr:hypothetical protein [Oligoflexia bacterium]